jgi:hypothetical protein
MNDNNDENNKQTNGVLYICIILLLIFYFVLFDRAFNGLKPDNIAGVLIMNGAIYWYVWKKNGWKPLFGAVLGIVIYLLLVIIAGAVAIKYSN